MIAEQRRKRLTDAMQESGLDVLLVYGIDAAILKLLAH